MGARVCCHGLVRVTMSAQRNDISVDITMVKTHYEGIPFRADMGSLLEELGFMKGV